MTPNCFLKRARIPYETLCAQLLGKKSPGQTKSQSYDVKEIQLPICFSELTDTAIDGVPPAYKLSYIMCICNLGPYVGIYVCDHV